MGRELPSIIFSSKKDDGTGVTLYQYYKLGGSTAIKHPLTFIRRGCLLP